MCRGNIFFLHESQLHDVAGVQHVQECQCLSTVQLGMCATCTKCSTSIYNLYHPNHNPQHAATQYFNNNPVQPSRYRYANNDGVCDGIVLSLLTKEPKSVCVQ